MDYGYQGENIIKVGNDSYFGFPRRAKNRGSMEKQVDHSVQYELQPGEHEIGTIPGWQPGENQFRMWCYCNESVR